MLCNQAAGEKPPVLAPSYVIQLLATSGIDNLCRPSRRVSYIQLTFCKDMDHRSVDMEGGIPRRNSVHDDRQPVHITFIRRVACELCWLGAMQKKSKDL